MAVFAPLCTIGLFAVCLIISVYLRLALTKPIVKKKRTTPKRPRRTSRKIYFLTDVKNVFGSGETERPLMEGKLDGKDVIR